MSTVQTIRENETRISYLDTQLKNYYDPVVRESILKERNDRVAKIAQQVMHTSVGKKIAALDVLESNGDPEGKNIDREFYEQQKSLLDIRKPQDLKIVRGMRTSLLNKAIEEIVPKEQQKLLDEEQKTRQAIMAEETLEFNARARDAFIVRAMVVMESTSNVAMTMFANNIAQPAKTEAQAIQDAEQKKQIEKQMKPLADEEQKTRQSIMAEETQEFNDIATEAFSVRAISIKRRTEAALTTWAHPEIVSQSHANFAMNEEMSETTAQQPVTVADRPQAKTSSNVQTPNIVDRAATASTMPQEGETGLAEELTTFNPWDERMNTSVDFMRLQNAHQSTAPSSAAASAQQKEKSSFWKRLFQ